MKKSTEGAMIVNQKIYRKQAKVREYTHKEIKEGCSSVNKRKEKRRRHKSKRKKKK